MFFFLDFFNYLVEMNFFSIMFVYLKGTTLLK